MPFSKLCKTFGFIFPVMLTIQRCVRLIQVFSINLFTPYLSVHDSVAMLFKMELVDSSSDSGQLTDLK